MKKKIIVNAMSAQLGGGQTHLLNMFSSGWGDYNVVFLTSSSNSLVFEESFGKERVINVGKVGNNFFLRTIWENLFLSKLAIAENASHVFLAAGLAPFWMTAKCKWIAISHNLLPFSWKSIAQADGLGLKLKLLIIRYAQIWSFQHVNGVVFTSNYAKKVISHFFKKKVHDVVIPSGINPMFFEKQDALVKDRYMLYVSTFFEYKHQKEVIHAFKKLPKEDNLKLVLVGSNSGQYGEDCKKLAAELGIGEQVIFMGNIPYGQLPGLMQGSVVNIFASDCENCPNILLEYLASGTPVLSSNFEPMPEFGKNFVTYFDPTNPADLALKLENQLQKTEKASQVERQEIKRLYSWSLAAKELRKFFDSL